MCFTFSFQRVRATAYMMYTVQEVKIKYFALLCLCATPYDIFKNKFSGDHA